ncbi:hypothetical protein F5Y16DRAFT_392348, partial [Xylariaceae sp. FL0255]
RTIHVFITTPLSTMSYYPPTIYPNEYQSFIIINLTLLAGFFSNIHLIIWYISDKFREWEKTIMIDFTFSVIWLSLTVVAIYSHDRTKQDESLMPLLDAAFWRADVVLVVVLGVGSAIFIVELFVDLFLNKIRTGYYNDYRNETRHSSAKYDG